jgi:hypothetical protein
MHRLQAFGRHRFVGNITSKEVHDRWHGDCEDCLLEGFLKDGQAVGFEPDTLDAALSHGFETCPHCFGRDEPSGPPWDDGDAGSD